jgi:hypothetical protein
VARDEKEQGHEEGLIDGVEGNQRDGFRRETV